MPHQRGRVLIVDDDPLSTGSLSILLSDYYDTFLAENGEEAVEMARTISPDVILLDIIMPDMDGYQVMQHIMADPALCDIPVLFITCKTEEECEAMGLMLGAHDYLTKPYKPNIVRLRVKNHLELKKKNDLVKHQRDLLALKNDELEKALSRVHTLEGIITICMYCKQIRNKSEAWEQLETYLSDHCDVRFSHGICPECYKEGKHRSR